MMNKALLSKWVVRYGNERSSMWREVIAGKNRWQQAHLMPDPDRLRRSSNVWRNVIKVFKGDDVYSTKIRNCMGIMVGNGDNISFWDHEWIHGVILKTNFPRVFSLAERKEGVLSSFGFLDNEGWKWKVNLRRSCMGWELEQWQSFLDIIDQHRLTQDAVDRIIWKPNKSGIFTVKGVMKELQAINKTVDPIWNKVWTGIAPLKVETFVWQLILERIPVRSLLMERSVITREEAVCAFCKLKLETTYHLLFECIISWQVWMKICAAWGITWTIPGDIKSFVSFWMDSSIETNSKLLLRLLFCATVWSLWLCRNSCIFEGKEVNVPKIYEMTIYRFVMWFDAKFHEETINVEEVGNNPRLLLTHLRKKRKAVEDDSKWVKPGSTELKFNVDAALCNDTGQGGIGGILRDGRGNTKVVFSKQVYADKVEEAEFLAIMEALKIYDHLNYGGEFTKLTIESDSSIACQWFEIPNKIPWGLQPQRQVMDFLKQKQPRVWVRKIRREANEMADNLAKAGINRNIPLVAFL